MARAEPGPVADLSSPVLLMGELTTQARTSLALLGLVSRGQCALAVAPRAL